MRKLSYSALLAVVFILFAGVPSALAAAPNSAYQHLLARLSSLKTYQATIHSTISLVPINGQGRPNTINSVETVVYEHPNKLSMKSEGLMGGMQLVSNGKIEYQYSALANQYTEKPAPGNLFQALFGKTSSSGNLHVVGKSVVDGVPVTILKGTASTAQGPAQTTLYIGQKDNLLHRFRAALPHLPGQQGSSFRMVIEQDFTHQVVDAPVPGSAFQFTPPANSTKVSSLGFGGQGGSGPGLPGLP